MDNVINKIIDMDRQAVTITEKIKEMMESNEIRLKEQLKELEEAALQDARNKGNEAYEKLVLEGKLEQEKINLQGQKECEALEKLFLTIHPGLEEDLFKEIF